MLIVALIAAVWALIGGFWLYAALAHRRDPEGSGRASDFAREHIREVVVERPLEEARSLCDAALSEALGTRAAGRRRPDCVEAWARLDERAVRQRLRLRLERVGAGRTLVVVAGRKVAAATWAAMAMPAITRARRRQVDRLAEWLAEHGPGKLGERRVGDVVWW